MASEQRLIQLRVPVGQNSILTTLLKIDSANDALIFDGTSDPSLTRQICTATSLQFEASENGVRISFTAGPAELCSLDDRPALRLPVPSEVTRVQRREAFRVATPQNDPVLCTVPLDSELISLPLLDLSSTGLGASDPQQKITINAGEVLTGCQLCIPKSEPITVNLRLIHLREFERADKKIRKAGFAFENLRGNALVRVQRYISTLEREALARTRGW